MYSTAVRLKSSGHYIILFDQILPRLVNWNYRAGIILQEIHLQDSSGTKSYLNFKPELNVNNDHCVLLKNKQQSFYNQQKTLNVLGRCHEKSTWEHYSKEEEESRSGMKGFTVP